jgi:hypothetical protein
MPTWNAFICSERKEKPSIGVNPTAMSTCRCSAGPFKATGGNKRGKRRVTNGALRARYAVIAVCVVCSNSSTTIAASSYCNLYGGIKWINPNNTAYKPSSAAATTSPTSSQRSATATRSAAGPAANNLEEICSSTSWRG